MPLKLDTVEVNAKNEAAFDFEEVQLQFQLESEICKLLVRNNHVNLILKTGAVHIINLDDPEVVIDIQLPLGKDHKLKNAWIDSHGYHLILQSTKNEYYYINNSSSTYHVLNKLKNLNVTSISFFDECVKKDTTGHLLVSTANSLLLEYAISSNKEVFLRTILKNKNCLTHILNTAIAQESGIASYSINLFTVENSILNVKVKIPLEPSNNVSVFQSLAKIEPLIIKQSGISNISSDLKHIAYSESSSAGSKVLITGAEIKNRKSFNPSSIVLEHLQINTFVLTGYFILVLTANNHLEIYNQLSLQHLTSISLSYLDQKMQGISFDRLAKTFWLYSDRHVYELIVNFQESGIFTTMIQKHMFDDALSLLPNDKSAETFRRQNYILKKKGYYLLQKQNYKEAVQILAQTDESFDKVALKLFDLADKAILRYYLTIKLRSLPNRMKSQKKILSSWIVEIFIEQLNALENKLLNSHKKNTIVDENQTNGAFNGSNKNGEVSFKSDSLRNELYSFFSDNLNSFDKETIYQIIILHNRKKDLLHFAKLINDYHFVLKYYINLQMWDESLNILASQQDPELVYKCATVLLVNHPVKTIDTWVRLIDDLNELKLIPSLLTYNKTVAFPQQISPEHNQSLRFLKFLIYEKNVSNRIVHNTFFSILITYPNTHNENIILKQLESYQSFRKKKFRKFEKGETFFDYDFILRLSFKFQKIQSAIFIYSILGKDEEAVDLALDNDLIDAAILVADKPNEKDEYKRKELWLKISEKLISKVVINKDYIKQHQKMFYDDRVPTAAEENEDPIYVLLRFLTEKCDDLEIKDLLPLFPDFIVIDNFKESLIESLKKLSLEMNKAAVEMDNTLNESDKINQKIKDFQTSNFQIIEPFESCQLCHKILAIRKFIVFPCSHAFHQDCLVKNILESNDYKAKNSIYKIQKKILMNNKNPSVIEDLKVEIDHLLSKSCCLCSDMKINELDEPLIKSGDMERDGWDI
ncbi:hypothetical protein PMKS-000671 [Pichia membranifaciens]|uniref:Pep3/Vps18/deep orange domain-containing protein n=1 Tax=Pichia membranifaciens TaxID=4926 RepID=A0A1Q2YCD0_9ASCO|nr:hypothetical protein PMKS-000671 [Pichia membranifaciens]